MNESLVERSDAIPNKYVLWTGRVISALVIAAFTMSGVMKFMGGPELEDGMKHLGFPLSIVTPLAILELTCVVFYAIPRTAIVGAILLTGYMGGAICTHWRVGDAFIPQIIIGVLVWLGPFLREPRLWSVLPWRKH